MNVSKLRLQTSCKEYLLNLESFEQRKMTKSCLPIFWQVQEGSTVENVFPSHHLQISRSPRLARLEKRIIIQIEFSKNKYFLIEFVQNV